MKAMPLPWTPPEACMSPVRRDPLTCGLLFRPLELIKPRRETGREARS
jgi:hypothetical protein